MERKDTIKVSKAEVEALIKRHYLDFGEVITSAKMSPRGIVCEITKKSLRCRK